MSEWQTVKLGDVAIVKGGKRLPKGNELTTVNTGHPYIRARDIKDGKITFEVPVFVPDDVLSIIKNYKVNAGDICITIVGANVGDIGQVPAFLNGANLTENAVKVIAVEEKCYQEYLKYVLLTERPQAEMKTVAGGAAQPKLGIYKIVELEIPLPPLPIQRRIAAILSAYDDLIENNARRIKLLEQAAHDLYREWFVEFRFPGHESVPLVDSGTDYGMIPQGWGVVRFKEIAQKHLKSIRPFLFPNKYFNHYSIPAFDNDRLPVIESGENIKSAKHVVVSNGVLVSKINPRIPRVWLPDITEGRESIASTEFLVITPVEPIKLHFLFALCSSTFFSDRLKSLAGGTSTSHQRVKPTDLFEFNVIRPISDRIQEYEDFAETTFAEIAVLRRKNQILREARDLLLPRLVSGELDVSEVEIGE